MKALHTAAFLLLAATLHGQSSYSVIHVIGKIYVPASQSYLKPGDRLDANAQLKFESPESKAAVLSSDKGRYVLAAEKTGAGQQNDLLYALASAITPVSGRMSSRAGAINNRLDFQKAFAETTTAWVSDSLYFPVSQTAFPCDASHFFFIRYDYKAQEINKKLESRSDTLFISRTALFSVDQKPVNSEWTGAHTLYYYDALTKKSDLICAFHFVIVPEQVVLSIYNAMDTLLPQDKIKATTELINTLYGSCTEDQVRAVIGPQ